MSDRILVGTRKGTFFVEKLGGRWTVRLAGHLGQGSNFVARDPSTGTLWAALGHGHWGAKLSRSTDDGKTWNDAAQIKYPEGAKYLAPPDPTESGVGPGEATLRDAIWDFSLSQGDRIDLSPIDADPAAAGDQAFAWIGSAAFAASGVAQARYRQASGSTYVETDTNGDGVADGLSIRLFGTFALTEAQMVL